MGDNMTEARLQRSKAFSTKQWQCKLETSIIPMLSQRQVNKMQVAVTEYFNKRSNLFSFTSPSQVRKVDSSQGTLAILHSHGLSVLDLVKDEEGSSKTMVK